MFKFLLKKTQKNNKTLICKSLEELLKDKGSDNGWLGYTKYLERVCKPLKDEKFDFLEIGIGGHNYLFKETSIHAWYEYFQYANIYGLDASNKSQYNNDRIKTIKGLQQNEKVLNKLSNKLKNLKIVIDDGSHLPEHQIITFKKLFPIIKPGGFYAILDLEYNYSKTYSDTKINSKKNIVNFFSSLVHYANSGIIFDNELNDKDKYDSIANIKFSHSMIIVEKKKRKPKQIKYLKLLNLNKKKHLAHTKRDTSGKINLKKNIHKQNNFISINKDNLNNYNIFIDDETSFVEMKIKNRMCININFPKDINIKYYKILPSSFTPTRAPSKWKCTYYDDNNSSYTINFKSTNSNLLFDKMFKINSKKKIKKISFEFYDNFEQNLEKIIRINKIEFYSNKNEESNIFIENHIDQSFIKNFYVSVYND